MPGPLHSKVLYQTAQDFLKKLEDMLVNYKDYLPLQKQLSSDMEHFSWETLVKQYDSILEDFLL